MSQNILLIRLQYHVYPISSLEYQSMAQKPEVYPVLSHKYPFMGTYKVLTLKIRLKIAIPQNSTLHSHDNCFYHEFILQRT